MLASGAARQTGPASAKKGAKEKAKKRKKNLKMPFHSTAGLASGGLITFHRPFPRSYRTEHVRYIRYVFWVPRERSERKTLGKNRYILQVPPGSSHDSRFLT